MTPENDRMLKTAVFYNQLINFFWSVLAFVPVVYFCYQYLPSRFLFTFLGISSLSLFLPFSWLLKLQLSQHPNTYRKIGIRFIKRYTQDGDLVNRFIQSRFPEYKYLKSRHSVKKIVSKSYVNEKFHYMIFVFFLCISLYALWYGLFGWAIFLITANIVYNLYPVFLQQYNRVRINQLKAGQKNNKQ